MINGNMDLEGKIILLTGGTGSFGTKFAEIVLNECNPQKIRIFSRGEKKQFDMQNKFKDNRLRFFIGDVRDKDRLYRAMKDVDVIIHAAALKQVPACEYNPIEAIRTNIEGAINVIDVAIDKKVERVMAISTDKAVHPVNLYGATKMTAEKLFVQSNSYATTRDKLERYSKFSCVRYGNVIGSRGSVIPLFKEQKKTGEISITDERMTRFWIRIGEGVRFVIKCLGMMEGGEIFVPKIPSMKIVDMADVIAPNVKKRIIGIRGGEKIHEVLLTEDESRHSREFDNFFVIEPEHPFWRPARLNGGKSLPEGFRYSSDNNKEWLNKKDMEMFS